MRNIRDSVKPQLLDRHIFHMFMSHEASLRSICKREIYLEQRRR